MKTNLHSTDKQLPFLQENVMHLNLIKSYRRRLKQYGLYGIYTGEDVLSEAFIRLTLSLRAGKTISNQQAWLRSAGFYYIQELSRKNKKCTSIDNCDLERQCSSNDDIQSSLERQENKIQIEQALQELSSKDRELLQMRFFENLSWEGIAARLAKRGEQVTSATLRKRGERAIVALRKVYFKNIS